MKILTILLLLRLTQLNELKKILENKIIINEEYKELIPQYLELLKKDIQKLKDTKDQNKIKLIIHKIRGSSKSFGLYDIDIIMEALKKKPDASEEYINILEQYIKKFMTLLYNNQHLSSLLSYLFQFSFLTR